MKHLRVLTKGNLHMDFLNTISQGVSSWDILYADCSNLKYISSRIQKRPLFSAKYVLRLSVNRFEQGDLEKVIKLCKQTEYTQVVVITENFKTYERMSGLVDSGDMLSFNIYRLKKGYILKYIETRLKPEFRKNSYIETIYSCSLKQVGKLDEYLYLINEEPEITVSKLKRLLPKADKYPLTTLLVYILTRDKQEDVLKHIAKYRYGHRWFKKEVSKMLEDVAAEYVKYLKGEWCLLNLKEYSSTKSALKLKVPPQKCIKIYDKVSLNYVLEFSYQFNKHVTSSLTMLAFMESYYRGGVNNGYNAGRLVQGDLSERR